MKPIDVNSPETKSTDLVGSNVEALRALFPEAFTEGRVDFEVLKQLLGDVVDEREEKYGLNWHGIHAIGSGAALAMDQLNKRAQNLGFSLARTIFHVDEAMLEAQKEKTVGPATNYLILTKGQPMTHISPDSELISRWRSAYTGRDTDGLDSPDVNFAVQREMKRVQMPPYDIEFPVAGDSS